jgi:hypothetical protein
VLKVQQDLKAFKEHKELLVQQEHKVQLDLKELQVLKEQ